MYADMLLLHHTCASDNIMATGQEGRTCMMKGMPGALRPTMYD